MTAASPGATHSQITLAAATLSPASGVPERAEAQAAPVRQAPAGQVDRARGGRDVGRGERRGRGQHVGEQRPRGGEAGERRRAHVLVPARGVGVVRARRSERARRAAVRRVDRGRRRLVRRVDADRVLAQRRAERRHAVARRRADVREQRHVAARPAARRKRDRVLEVRGHEQHVRLRGGDPADELRHVDGAEVVAEAADVRAARVSRSSALGARGDGPAVDVVHERHGVAERRRVAMPLGRHLIGDERDRRPPQHLAGRRHAERQAAAVGAGRQHARPRRSPRTACRVAAASADAGAEIVLP